MSRSVHAFASFVAASLLACVSQPTNEARESGSSTPERRPAPRPKPACAELPEGVLVLLEREGCPVVLRRDLAGPGVAPPTPAGPAPSEPASPSEAPVVTLELVALADKSAASPSETLGRGPAPAACGESLQRCEFEGLVSELGPILLVRERGHESEHPVQVWLGIHEAGRLGFVPSWHDESSLVDHTRIGPPFALAPYACEGELRLLPHARLPEAEGEHPPASLAMLAGRWVVGEQGLVAVPQRPSPSSEGCTLLLEIP